MSNTKRDNELTVFTYYIHSAAYRLLERTKGKRNKREELRYEVNQSLSELHRALDSGNAPRIYECACRASAACAAIAVEVGEREKTME